MGEIEAGMFDKKRFEKMKATLKFTQEQAAINIATGENVELTEDEYARDESELRARSMFPRFRQEEIGDFRPTIFGDKKFVRVE